MKKFSSDHHIPTVSLLWMAVAFLVSVPFLSPNDILGEALVPTAISLAGAALLVWILLDTKYAIDGAYLKYASGPIKGRIDIYRIHTIEHQKNWLVTATMKPALGAKGLIVKFNRYDDLYISPKKKQEFIEALLAINPHIEVRQQK